jgi:sodium transport system permease protein
MGILILIPMMPGILSSVYPLDTKGWMYAVPILGQHVLAADALGAKETPLWGFVAAALTAFLMSLLLLQLTTGLLKRERIIFSR